MALSNWDKQEIAASDIAAASVSSKVLPNSIKTSGAMPSSCTGETSGDMALDVVLVSGTLATSSGLAVSVSLTAGTDSINVVPVSGRGEVTCVESSPSAPGWSTSALGAHSVKANMVRIIKRLGLCLPRSCADAKFVNGRCKPSLKLGRIPARLGVLESFDRVILDDS